MASQPRLSFEAPTPDDRFLSAILRVSQQVEAVARDVAVLKQHIARQRREIKEAVKRQHVAAIAALGGRCPCCGSREVVGADGRKAEGAEFDHFYAASKPDLEHTWLICRPCHSDLTTGRLARDEREAEFRAYQNRRRRMAPRVAGLL
ncbi:MAG TPA: hypothetical protein VHB27_12055 [Rhodopila sp.]|uniref:hypothetical protein n=1 Tax=Rhodopila sp. TaxID=2480087 RepID=UPI002D1CE860|nr:hypothetical protein [Rhodopila sp.]HVY15954.1 hypothetical protein [Rhodopila sp.]